MSVPANPLRELRAFREVLYTFFDKRADALFESTDAILTAGSIPSPPHPSPTPVRHRGWGSLYDASSKGRIEEGAVRGLLARYPMVHDDEDRIPVYAGDATPDALAACAASEQLGQGLCKIVGRVVGQGSPPPGDEPVGPHQYGAVLGEAGDAGPSSFPIDHAGSRRDLVCCELHPEAVRHVRRGPDPHIASGIGQQGEPGSHQVERGYLPAVLLDPGVRQAGAGGPVQVEPDLLGVQPRYRFCRPVGEVRLQRTRVPLPKNASVVS